MMFLLTLSVKLPFAASFTLAATTIVGRSTALFQSDDRGFASQAGFVLTVVNVPSVRIAAAEIAAFEIFRIDRPTRVVVDGLRQNGTNALEQLGGLACRDAVSRYSRVDTGSEHCLGGVNVAEPADLGLIEQKLLERAARTGEDRSKIFERKLAGKWLGGEFRDLLRGMKSVGFDDLHQPEVPLIVKNEPLVFGKMKDGMGELGVSGSGRQKGKPTAHPQVDDQRFLIIEVQEYVLAAAADQIDCGTVQTVGKFGRRRVGSEPFAQQ